MISMKSLLGQNDLQDLQRTKLGRDLRKRRRCASSTPARHLSS
jgi:hypothetical protein